MKRLPRWVRLDARWQRIRAQIGECARDVNPDQLADCVMRSVMDPPAPRFRDPGKAERRG